jgi:uncharacterized protein YjeT (DUF2065 family)
VVACPATRRRRGRQDTSTPQDPEEADTPSQPTPGSDDASNLSEENARLQAELEALRESTAIRKRTGRHRARRVLAGVLVVLTSLCIVAATIGVWTQRTLSDTDRYVALVAPLADDPAVTDPLAARLSEEVFVALDVEDRVQEAIASFPNVPPAASFLAGPITAGAQNLIQQRVEEFLASPTFSDLWTELNRQLHVKLQALLNEDYEQLPNVAISGGEVQLNLVSIVAVVIQRLAQRGVDALGIDVTVPSIPASLGSSAAIDRLSSALGVTLPSDFGQVTIMSAEQLSGYQDAVRALKRLVLAAFLLSLILIALTIWVAPDRRRVVIWLGLGVIAALFLGAVFLRRVEASIVDAIEGPAAKAAAQDVFDQVSSSLRQAGLFVLTIGVVAALLAYLLGRPPWFQRTAGWLERITATKPGGSELQVWVSQHADPIRLGGGLIAVFVLFLTGIDWIPVAVVGVLFGLFLWGVASAEHEGRPPAALEQE